MQPIADRCNADGPWFKGNAHIHTTFSDGGKDYRTVATMYAERGYDFVFITDHGRVADIEGQPDLPLLALNGVEIDGVDGTGAWFHALGLGYSGSLLNGVSFDQQFTHLQQAGAIVVLAHPCWSGNSVADSLRHAFDGVEAYNHICNYLNGKSLSTYHWDRMLAEDPRTLAFSVDDAHLNGNEPWDGGWIMVSAPALNRDSILNSIQAGSFYSTQGPLFKSIHVEQGRISVRTSPVSMIRLVDNTAWGDRVFAGTGKTVTEGEFAVTGRHAYLRVEIEDEHGRLAWTNALMEPRDGE